MSELQERIEAIAKELIEQRDWLANGHRASDYGHDLMIALGNPDCPKPAAGGGLGAALAGIYETIDSIPRSVEHVEWRVTGKPGNGYPPYDFTFGGPNDRKESAEERARGFVRLVEDSGLGWDEGPVLHRRTVVETSWMLVEEARRA